jgi:hypothetical protein
VPVTAKLSRKFYERLGDDIADELVDWFNAVDATYKSDLKETNDLNWERFKGHLDSRLKQMDAHVESRLTYMEARLQSMDARLDSRIDRLRADLMKWMFIYWSGTVAAIIGMGYFGPK